MMQYANRDRARRTLCGDRACRMRERKMQILYRCANVRLSANSFFLAWNTFAEIVRVECAKARRNAKFAPKLCNNRHGSCQSV